MQDTFQSQALLLKDFLHRQQLINDYPFLEKLFSINWDNKLFLFEKIMEALCTFDNSSMLKFCLFLQNAILKGKYMPDNPISIQIYKLLQKQIKVRSDLSENDVNQSLKVLGLLLLNQESSKIIMELFENIEKQLNAKEIDSRESKIEIIRFLVLGFIENQTRDYRFFGNMLFKMSFLRNFSQLLKDSHNINDLTTINRWLGLLKQIVRLITNLDSQYSQFKLAILQKIMEISLENLKKHKKRVIEKVSQCLICILPNITLTMLQEFIKKFKKIVTYENLLVQLSIYQIWGSVISCIISYQRKEITDEFVDDLNQIFQIFLETIFQDTQFIPISIKDSYCRTLSSYIKFIDTEHQSAVYYKLLKKKENSSTNQSSSFLLLSLSCIYFQESIKFREKNYNDPRLLNEKICKGILNCLKRFKQNYSSMPIEQFKFMLEQDCLSLKIILFQIPSLICKNLKVNQEILAYFRDIMKKKNSITINEVVSALLSDLKTSQQTNLINLKDGDIRNILYQVYNSQSLGFLKCFVNYISKAISKQHCSISVQSCVALFQNLLQKIRRLCASPQDQNQFFCEICILIKQLVKQIQQQNLQDIKKLFKICQKELVQTKLPCFLQPIIATLQNFKDSQDLINLLNEYDENFIAIYMIYVNQPGYVVIENLQKMEKKQNKLKFQINKALIQYKFAAIPFFHNQYDTIKITLLLCQKYVLIPANNEAFLGKQIFQLFTLLRNSIIQKSNFYDMAFEMKSFREVVLFCYKFLIGLRKKVQRFVLSNKTVGISLKEKNQSKRLIQSTVLIQNMIISINWILIRNQNIFNNSQHSQTKFEIWNLAQQNRKSFENFCEQNKLQFLSPNSMKNTLLTYLLLELTIFPKQFIPGLSNIESQYQKVIKKCMGLYNNQSNEDLKLKRVEFLLRQKLIK